MYKAIQIIRHTLELIFNNLSMAIRITLPWVLVVIILSVAMNYVAPNGTNFYKKNISIEGVVLFLAIFFIVIIGFISCAINWHRYVLLGEVPQGIIMIPPTKLIKPYFVRLLGIFFIIIFSAFIAAVVQSIAAPFLLNLFASYIIVTLFFVPLNFVLQYILLRLGVCLPAIALGDFSISLSKAWGVSRKENTAIIFISLLIVLVETVLPIAIQQIFSGIAWPEFFSYIHFLGSIILDWVYLLFSIGILTTLYGLTVEGRKI